MVTEPKQEVPDYWSEPDPLVHYRNPSYAGHTACFQLLPGRRVASAKAEVDCVGCWEQLPRTKAEKGLCKRCRTKGQVVDVGPGVIHCARCDLTQPAAD